jgi:type IV pilus assembly protein PilB
MTASLTESREHLQFGTWLVQQGRLSEADLQKALDSQRAEPGRLGEVLTRMNLMSETDVIRAVGEFLSIEYIDLDDYTIIDSDVSRRIPENIAKRLELIAISQEDDTVRVAMADPLNIVAIDTVTVKLKRQVKPLIAMPRKIRQAIEFVYHGVDVDQQQMKDIVDLQVQTDDPSKQSQEDAEFSADGITEADAQDAPVIRFVDLMLSHAIKSRASDIHIEPQEKSMNIRMRVDGILCDMVPPSRKMQQAVIARIKVLAEMDIAERRLPQDGRFRIRMGKDRSDIDVRVSVLPTIYGEKVVLRILDKASLNHSLDALGLEPEMLARFRRVLGLPHGIVVPTTGSAKAPLISALCE